jgi:hypothetical protein
MFFFFLLHRGKIRLLSLPLPSPLAEPPLKRESPDCGSGRSGGERSEVAPANGGRASSRNTTNQKAKIRRKLKNKEFRRFLGDASLGFGGNGKTFGFLKDP